MSREALVAIEAVRANRPGGRSDCSASGRRAGVAWAILLAGFLSARVARAEDPVDISWNAPADCPDLDSVRAGVLRLAGDAAATGTRAEALVSREAPDRWRVDIQLTGSVEGARTLSAETCDAAARAAALVIAIAVNPEAASRLSEQLLEEEPPVEQAAVEPPPRAPRPEPAPHMLLGEVTSPDIRQGRLDFYGAVGGLLEGAVTPELAPGVLAASGLRTRSLRGELEASWVPPVEDTTGNRAVGGRFEVITATLRGCGGVLDRGIGLDVCAAARLHLIAADSFGTTEDLTRDLRLGSGAVSVEAIWPSHSVLAVRARAGVALPFTRPRFLIDDRERGTFETIYRPRLAGGELALALVVTPAEWLRGRNVRR